MSHGAGLDSFFYGEDEQLNVVEMKYNMRCLSLQCFVWS